MKLIYLKTLIFCVFAAFHPVTATGSTLDFTFSFTNSPTNGGGSVAGVVRGLVDNSTSMATSVEVLSNTSGFGVGEYVNHSDWNTWTVSGGLIVFAGFTGTLPPSAVDCCSLDLLFQNTPGFEYAELEEAGSAATRDADPASVGDLAFTPIAPVPVPAGLPLLLAGIGLIGFVARRRSAG